MTFTERDEETIRRFERKRFKGNGNYTNEKVTYMLHETDSEETLEESQTELDESTEAPSVNLPARSEVVKSPSMSLIDDSAKLLFDTMVNIGKSKEKTVTDIKSVCQCAEQIHKLMRLKYDVLRTFDSTQPKA